ncbi:MAG: hypothetical protein M1503_09645 [Thaumarchaeota archaeon]|nr:hypothetical protein [Nitrososphaerota archaeon]MCL5318502.1 hypothetical protein [Nitrososphaerota archaeon]
MSIPTGPKRGGVVFGSVPRQYKWSDAIAGSFFAFLTVAFFAAHQAWATGFFLPSFGLVEQVLFYGSILFSAVVTANILAFGIREDRAVMLQMIGAALWVVTTAWLYMVFPFNFSHFADVVPTPLQFLVTWLTNDIARIIWALIVIGSVAFIPFLVLQLRGARRRIREQEKT